MLELYRPFQMLAVGGLGAERDRQVRLHSVHTDLELDLPTSIPLPDGEEIPYGSSARLHIRDSQQESEIYQKCIRAPPNRTVFEGESPPPPYRALAHWNHHNSVISPRLGGEAVVPPPVIVPASRQRVAMDSSQPGQPPSRQV